MHAASNRGLGAAFLRGVRPKATPGFTPASIAGLRVWYEGPIAGLADGAAVDVVHDRSGRGFDATAAAPSRPTYLATGGHSGGPCLAFDGTKLLTIPPAAFAGLASAEFVIVSRTDADPPPYYARTGFWMLGAAPDATHRPYIDGMVYESCGTTVRKGPFAYPVGSLAAWNVYDIATAPGLWECRLGGTLLDHTTVNVVGMPAAPCLGVSSSDLSIAFAGRVSAFLVFATVLADADRANLLAYYA